jgi:stage IV sporulation protein A
VLYEFPVRQLDFAMPRWITMLEPDHWLQKSVYESALDMASRINRMKDVAACVGPLCESVRDARVQAMDLASGIVKIAVELRPEIFYKVLGEQTGLELCDEASLMPCIISLVRAKKEFEKVRSALEQVEATGYGIVMPTIDELHLEEPEIVKQGNRYGVRLKACAPSIHLMKAMIHTEINPIVGSERQSEELVKSLLADFSEDPIRIWESNIFGKSLHELVNEGLQNKLLHMPQEARCRLQETLERVINEGCSGLICIIL